MQFATLISLALAGSAAAAPGVIARSFSTSVSSSTPSITPTPASGGGIGGAIESDAPPAVQAAESQYYADYSSYLSASGSAKQAIYSQLNPDLQAIQSAKAEAFSSIASVPIPSVTSTPVATSTAAARR